MRVFCCDFTFSMSGFLLLLLLYHKHWLRSIKMLDCFAPNGLN